MGPDSGLGTLWSSRPWFESCPSQATEAWSFVQRGKQTFTASIVITKPFGVSRTEGSEERMLPSFKSLHPHPATHMVMTSVSRAPHPVIVHHIRIFSPCKVIMGRTDNWLSIPAPPPTTPASRITYPLRISLARYSMQIRSTTRMTGVGTQWVYARKML